MSNRSKIVMPSQPNMAATDAGEFGQAARAMLRQPVVVRKAVVPAAVDADPVRAGFPKVNVGGVQVKNLTEATQAAKAGKAAKESVSWGNSEIAGKQAKIAAHHGRKALGHDADSTQHNFTAPHSEIRKHIAATEEHLKREPKNADPETKAGFAGHRNWLAQAKKHVGDADVINLTTTDSGEFGDAAAAMLRQPVTPTVRAIADADSGEFYKKLDNLPATRPRNHPGAAKVVKVNRETQKPEPKSKDSVAPKHKEQAIFYKPHAHPAGGGYHKAWSTAGRSGTPGAISGKKYHNLKKAGKLPYPTSAPVTQHDDSVAWGGNPSKSEGKKSVSASVRVQKATDPVEKSDIKIMKHQQRIWNQQNKEAARKP